MSENKKLDCGLISPNAKTVIVSAVLETVGQVRFGDGTEVALTVTEKDLVPTPGGGFVEKVVFSGSKRRGVDRRTIHALRNQLIRKVNNGQDQGPLFDCYIPRLCSECPTCWLYGSVGTVGEGPKKKDYNIKSRVLYASALSVEPSDIAVAVHNRNAPNELDHTTGEAGIHSEELIKANVHFPTITVLERVVDWEIGAFAHALMENVNGNRYTAASARQGGIRFSEGENDKLIVVDVSEQGIFPLETVKVPSDETDFAKVQAMFAEATDLEKIKKAFEGQGFKCENKDSKRDEPGRESTQDEAGDKPFVVKNGNGKELWTIKKVGSVITVRQAQPKDANKGKASDEAAANQSSNKKDNEAKILMTRYIGDAAYGYLRERQEDFKHFLEEYDANAWKQTYKEIQARLGLDTSTGAAQATTGRRGRGKREAVTQEETAVEQTPLESEEESESL